MTTPTLSRKAAAKAARIWMLTRWPKSIRAYKPLAIGIHEAILTAAEGIHPPRAISDALHAHTACPRYRAALSEPGAMRVDLDGVEIESVVILG